MVRNNSYQRGSLGIRERHNERKNAGYANPDVVPERQALNLHFKEPEGSYTECFDRLVRDGVISTRGLKPDAKIVCEFVFDVNTAWFEEQGGYDFARDFFAQAYQMAVKEAGDERYILSAVMHADERNRALSEKLGRDVYHYHLHVVYIPVVEKEIRWSKRCKDERLRGTVKEIIHQVSCSKKWAFQPALDEQGKPIVGKSGHPIRIPSYRLLQDRFYEHMKEAGYTTLRRGERGSDVQHLSTLDYKVCKEQERLAQVSQKVEEKEQRSERLDHRLKYQKQAGKMFGELESAGRKTLLGKRELEEREYVQIIQLAKEGILSRPKIHELTEQLREARRNFQTLRQSFDRLYEETRDFLRALKLAPKRVKAFLDEVLRTGREEPGRSAISRERER